MDVGQPSLDQLRVFLTVAEEGSFNRAAQRLGRAISVVSYAIGQLEGQLGVSLFSREGSRKPQLTPEGQALLAEARAVANDVDALVAKVRSLQQGLESELSLAVDVMVPGDAIARILREFQRMFPTVPLRLHVEALGAVAALVIDGQADIAIGGPVAADCPEVERQAIGSVELIPVAAPSHALAQMQTIPPGETRKHFQLVLTDRSPLTAGRDFSVLSPHSWRLADLGAKHVLLREGLGWGNMPRHMILDDLAKGALVHLDVPEGPRFDFQLSALWRRDRVPGPAAFWMLSAFQDARLGQP
ncbi:LysR family transcriptional regulator [Novosphingobium sp. PS1R-30]|uniref:LysR family transcriptional regulator n=1 Tax=Novosphingobium anseongense TaxID=3133436 RepID=A0ABU8RVE3_9SPHN